VSLLLGFDERVACIEQDAARLGLVTAESLTSPVPSCPGWSGRDLARHVAEVFTFFSHQLASGDPSQSREPPVYEEGEQADPVEWLDAASAVLVEVLVDLGPDEPCWNWSGVDLDAGWVARRMSLEVAIHRYDGELAANDPNPVAPGLAVDGIDERLEVYLRSDLAELPRGGLGGPLCLACSDVPASWVIEVSGGRLKVREGTGPAAAVLRGSASDLFLFSWNRLSPESLELTGDPAVAAAWAKLPCA
jgi:uncharacterized protein (TIGR03083 family)